MLGFNAMSYFLFGNPCRLDAAIVIMNQRLLELVGRKGRILGNGRIQELGAIQILLYDQVLLESALHLRYRVNFIGHLQRLDDSISHCKGSRRLRMRLGFWDVATHVCLLACGSFDGVLC